MCFSINLFKLINFLEASFLHLFQLDVMECLFQLLFKLIKLVGQFLDDLVIGIEEFGFLELVLLSHGGPFLLEVVGSFAQL